jgi:hypothetical protein
MGRYWRHAGDGTTGRRGVAKERAARVRIFSEPRFRLGMSYLEGNVLREPFIIGIAEHALYRD